MKNKKEMKKEMKKEIVVNAINYMKGNDLNKIIDMFTKYVYGYTKEIVVNAINDMNRDDLKKIIGMYIKCVPGYSDEELHTQKVWKQAIEIYNEMFADMYEFITGIKGEYAPHIGDDAYNAEERIRDILDGGILVRGIYRDMDDNGTKMTYLLDNITYKKSRVFVVEGGSITMDDINRFSHGVDVFLIDDDIKKELGM